MRESLVGFFFFFWIFFVLDFFLHRISIIWLTSPRNRRKKSERKNEIFYKTNPICVYFFFFIFLKIRGKNGKLSKNVFLFFFRTNFSVRILWCFFFHTCWSILMYARGITESCRQHGIKGICFKRNFQICHRKCILIIIKLRKTK